MIKVLLVTEGEADPEPTDHERCSGARRSSQETTAGGAYLNLLLLFRNEFFL